MESKLPQVIRVSECGTDMVNGLYRAISKQVRYGALKYANARYPNIHLTKEKTRNGKGWILGDPVKKLVYYAVKGDTDIPPVSNWKSHLGKKPVPLTKAIHSRRSLEEKRMKDAMKKANVITSSESNVGFLGKPLTKAQEQRRMVYEEIIATEKTYVKDMTAVLQFFAEPMVAQEIISPQERDLIFSNLRGIVVVNRAMLREIKKKQKSQLLSRVIGDVFHEYAPKMSVYTEYCINYHEALKQIRNLKKSNEEFAKYLNDMATTRAELRGLNLESMLIKPVQRICKYQLLLRDLLKNMEKSHKNRAQIENALSEVKRTATKVNAAMKDHEATRKVVDIYNTVLDLPHDLVAPWRKFEVEAIAKVVHVGSDDTSPVEYRMILFTDLLILCQEDESFWGEKTGIYRCSSVFDLTNLTNVYHESKSSKTFEFKYKKITETGSAVAKYVFDFMTSSTTSQVADVLQKQVDLSKLKAEKVQKRSSHRPGVRKFAAKRAWAKRSHDGSTGKASLKAIEKKYHRASAEVEQEEKPKEQEPLEQVVEEAKVARRKWATASGRKTLGRNATLGRQGVAIGLKKHEKKKALRQIRTLERQNQARHSVNVNKQREKMKQRKIFRENCYLEIINTERQFYQDLRLLLEFYRDSMDKKRLVKPIHLASIFSNIKEIMELSGALYNALKKEGQRSEVFASAFTKYAPYFEMYSIYCSTYGKGMDILKQCKTENSKLRKFVDNNTRGGGLDSLLVKPVQRICKYPLFFKSLIKHMEEEHPHRPAIINAMEQIKEVAGKVDDNVKQWSERQKVIEVFEKVDDCPKDLVKPNRTLVCHLQAMLSTSSKKAKPYEIYVFNDIVLLVKNKTSSTWTFSQRITQHFKHQLSLLNVTLKRSSKSSTSFEILHKKKHASGTNLERYHVECGAEEECMRSMQGLMDAQEDHLEQMERLDMRRQGSGDRRSGRGLERRTWTRRTGRTASKDSRNEKKAGLKLLERRYVADQDGGNFSVTDAA